MAKSSSRPRLRDLLRAEDVVSEGQMRDALNTIDLRQGKVAETLIELGYLDVETLEKFIVNQPGIASIDLSQYRIIQELCELLPEEIVRQHQLFPIDHMGNLLTIGMAMPLDGETIAMIESLSALRVKALYCNPAHIAGAIDRYYPDGRVDAATGTKTPSSIASGTSLMITVADLLRKIDELPSLPETVTKIKEALDDPEIEMKKIEVLIERDPLVAAKLLKLANSAAYSFSGRIAQIPMAMRLLGLQEIYNLVLASTVLSMLENAQGFDYERFWNEALFTASAVPLIAKVADVRPTPALATAGLLHDIGRFALVQVSPERYKKIAPNYSGVNLATVEQELLGLSHPEAGYAVADHWDLPTEITTLIRYHHRPERAESMQTEACILSLATFLAEAHLKGEDRREIRDIDCVEHPLTHLKISTDQMREIYDDVIRDFAA